MSAPSPAFQIPRAAAEMFAEYIVCEYAYFTPSGEPLCWPVTPYWHPDRGVPAIATGLAYPNKADYAKRNPKVALYFSDPNGSGISHPQKLLVLGEATVLDSDIQQNTDRYVRAMREKFAAARLGLNPITVKFLDFYLPRLWVEITPVRLIFDPGPVAVEQHDEGIATSIGPRESEVLARAARTFGEAVVTTRDPQGYPSMIRTRVEPGAPGVLRLEAAPGPGSAALTFHRHTLGGTRFEAHMARGRVTTDGVGPVFAAHRLVGFFGNGLVFPLSVVPHVMRLRRRLRAELERRGQPMPKLRVP